MSWWLLSSLQVLILLTGKTYSGPPEVPHRFRNEEMRRVGQKLYLGLGYLLFPMDLSPPQKHAGVLKRV